MNVSRADAQPVTLTPMTLAWLCAAWIAGVAAAATAGRGAWPLPLAIAACALAAALVRRERRVVLYAVALPAVFVCGVARHEQAEPSLAADAAARYNDGVHVRLRGVLRDDPAIGDTTQRFAVSVRSVQVAGAWVDASGGVLVRAPLYPRYRSGDVLDLEGALESPPQLEGFDYAAYLERRGIASVMEFPQARLAGHDNHNPLRATILRARRSLSRGLRLALAEPQASLAQGVLLGERSALPADLRDDLNTTGTSHLVVVSGSNVALVSAYVTLLFAWIGGRRRALALSIVVVVAYAMLVGASPPVLRATIMGLLLIVARLSGRPSSGITSILLAAAIMAGLDPPVLRDVSFQLSFSATAGIVYLAPSLRSWIIELLARALRSDELPRWVAPAFADPLAVTLAAIAATTPLLALNFGRLSLVAMPANALVVPAFPFILGASLIAALGGLLPEGRMVLAAPAHYLLTYWIETARWLASAPGAAASIDGYSTRWAVATYAILAAAMIAFLRYARPPLDALLAESRPLSLRALRRPAMIAVPAIALATSLGVVLWPSPPRRLEVTVLDVGQGDAILVETPGGASVLVDGGPGGAVLRGLGKQLSWRDRSIDVVVLTHPQTDHLTGLIDVLERYDVRNVIAGPGGGNSAAYDAWLDALSDEGASAFDARRGESIDFGDGVVIHVLWPDDDLSLGGDLNNASIVLRISLGNVSFLLTGDIEAAAEQALLDDGAELRTSVLKVAHHGSATSSTRAFLDAVRPDVAVISAGRDNLFGHPSPEVVGRLDDYAEVLSTSEQGAVHIETDGRRIWIETER